MKKGCITDIKGVKAGHYSDQANKTGATVVILPQDCVCGVDVRGSAPGTRETDALRCMNAVQSANAFMLTGGSAFGLAAADGVVRYLEENNIGFETGYAKVPIVSAAVLFDLGYGNPKIRPTADNGYEACMNALECELDNGRFGAGTGATTGKLGGMEYAGTGGFGSASMKLGDVIVAACFAVNAVGDIYSYDTGQKIAGMLGAEAINVMLNLKGEDLTGKNTVIGIVGTNAKINKEQANKLAEVGQDGIAITVRPAHTMFDGDTVFAFGSSEVEGEINSILAAATLVSARAIENAVLAK